LTSRKLAKSAACGSLRHKATQMRQHKKSFSLKNHYESRSIPGNAPSLRRTTAPATPGRARQRKPSLYVIGPHRQRYWGRFMLKWALIFFIISIIAGLFGFTGISAATAGIAKILFAIFLIIAIIWVIVAFAVGAAVF
jgi:uncharacterized membrane protein YtjA (UPF0391 family)